MALVLAASFGAGGFFGWREWRERVVWREAAPAVPDLARWPAELREAVVRGDARVRANAGSRDVVALGELASLYHANGFLPEAEQCYRALLVFDGHNARWPHRLAVLLAGGGQLDEAIALGRRAVELAPDDVPARLRAADALLKSNRATEARASYDAVLARAPDDPYALLGLARLDLADERWTGARERLEHAVRTNPAFFGALSLLATVYDRLGDSARAATMRTRASEAGRFREAPDPWIDELEAQCFDVYRLQVIASAAAAAKEPRDALAPLERALTIAPDDARTHRQLAGVRNALGDPAAARRELEKAVALEPTNVSARLDLVALLKQHGDMAAAKAVIAEGLARCDDKAGLFYEQGMMFLEEKNLEEAVGAFSRARELSPEKLDAYVQLAGTLMRLGREDEGLAVLNAAIARDRNCAQALVFLSRYYVRHDDAENADTFFGRAREAGATAAQFGDLEREFRERFGRAPR